MRQKLLSQRQSLRTLLLFFFPTRMHSDEIKFRNDVVTAVTFVRLRKKHQSTIIRFSGTALMTVYCEKRALLNFQERATTKMEWDFLGDQLANGNKLCCANDRDFLNTAWKRCFFTRSLGGDFSASRKKISGHDNDFLKHPNRWDELSDYEQRVGSRSGFCDLGNRRHPTTITTMLLLALFKTQHTKNLLPAVLKLNSTLAVINSLPIHGNVFFGNAEASVPRNSQRIKNKRKADRPTTV